MLAPYCEAELAEPVIRAAGIEGLALWRAAYPGLVNAGTLVLAQARDTPELKRYARMAPGHVEIDRVRIATLEPDLAPRFHPRSISPTRRIWRRRPRSMRCSPWCVRPALR